MSDITITLASRATPEAVWHALTDGSVTPAYYLGFQAEYDLTAGAPYRYSVGGGSMISGTRRSTSPPASSCSTVHSPPAIPGPTR
ncbi:MAG: hypothetical protein U0Q03_15945 [Acidimicrobiales bacterium]